MLEDKKNETKPRLEGCLPEEPNQEKPLLLNQLA